MPKFEISVDLPKGVDVIRIQQSKDGWEATCLSHKTMDKWDMTVDPQYGYSFKQHSPNLAIKHAADMARAATIKLVSQRNAKPDPRLSPEEQLLKALGLS